MKLTLSSHKDTNQKGKEYTYYQVNYVKKNGELVAIKRIFLSELEQEALRLLEENDK